MRPSEPHFLCDLSRSSGHSGDMSEISFAVVARLFATRHAREGDPRCLIPFQNGFAASAGLALVDQLDDARSASRFDADIIRE